MRPTRMRSDDAVGLGSRGLDPVFAKPRHQGRVQDQWTGLLIILATGVFADSVVPGAFSAWVRAISVADNIHVSVWASPSIWFYALLATAGFVTAVVCYVKLLGPTFAATTVFVALFAFVMYVSRAI